MSSTDLVRVSTLVQVDPDTAFAVFTEEVDAWWKSGPRYRVDPARKSTMRFEPGIGGRLLEVYDDDAGDAFEHGRIQVWKPGDRLVFGMSGRHHEAPDATEVEVRFEPEGAGTRVTIEHRGWDAIPADHPVRHGLAGPAFDALMGSWWADLLVSLGARAGRDRAAGGGSR